MTASPTVLTEKNPSSAPALADKHPQDMFAEMRHTTRFTDRLEPPGLNAAAVLRFLQNAASAETAALFEPVIPFARQIPALSGNILELHFGEDSVDFATRLNVDFDKLLTEEVKRKPHMLPSVNHDFILLAKQQRNGFDFGIENIWIEYDAPFHGAPSLFFDINRNDAFRPASVYPNLQQITAIFGCRINIKLLQFLEQVKRAGLHVVYYGLMFSRDPQSVRLTINGIPAVQLADLLKSLGWKGNYDALKKVTTTYLAGKQKLVVGVDFNNHIEDRIGIEVLTDNHAAFAKNLYNNQHINKRHVDLLHGWQQRFQLPENLSAALTRLHQRPIQWLYTRINHFKFVINSGEPTAVKGYLYYCF